MIYRIYGEQAITFEKWAEENNISFEKLREGNYAECCPECGDYEFWYDGCCSHCGYSL